jgi:hypothetical protein
MNRSAINNRELWKAIFALQLKFPQNHTLGVDFVRLQTT